MINLTDNKIYNIELKIKTQRFYNSETCYGIYTGYLIKSNEHIELQPLKQNENYNRLYNSAESLMVLKGISHQLIPGNTYSVECYEEFDSKWGQQFVITNVYVDIPTTDKDEQEFLKSLVTNNQYYNIVSVYKNPITQILNNTFDYKSIKSFSYRSLNALKTKVNNNLVCMSVKSALSEYKLSLNQIKQLLKAYPTPEIAIQKVKENPYILFMEVTGIGFKTCDTIALSSNISLNDPRRITAAIFYLLIDNENTKSNSYAFINNILNKLVIEFNVPVDNIEKYISDEKLFYNDGLRIAQQKVYNCELAIAKDIYRLFQNPNQYCSSEKVTEYIANIEVKLNIKYDDKQKELFYAINSDNVIVFTGSAGTGKTTTLNGALSMLDSLDKSYILMSPTARAAKQMTKSTNRKASTIHRALGILSEVEEDDNEVSTIDVDVIVIDEISMTDIYIFRKVLRSIQNGSKLLLVGDYAQLESVAIGNVLYDIMISNTVPVVKLDKVFRQALDSGTLNVATKVRYGQQVCDSSRSAFTYGVKGDCNIWLGDKETIIDRLMTIYKDCINNGINSNDIMVLSPTKKSISGVYNLNNIIQNYINPYSIEKNEISIEKDKRTFVFREHDKVMHIKNDYHAEWLNSDFEPIINPKTNEPYKGVFNGDIGQIIEVNPDTKEIYVDYGEFIIAYTNTSNLELSYVSTIHKAQGGSAPVVIMVLSYEHFSNLKRSLLYTGITRASDVMYLITEINALQYTIDNDVMIKKQTFLTELLQKEFNNIQ